MTIDYVGKIDGEAFAGGSGTDQPLVLGSKEFIPGFEDQLIGAKAGDEKLVTVTFPENYQRANLAGKEATFDVTVKEVSKPGELEINDEMAKNLGLESLERLREIVRGQIESQFGSMTRQKVKRQLLDQLDAAYSVRGAVEAGRGRVHQHLEPGQPRSRSRRPHLRRRGDDGRRSARRIHAACRAPRAPRPGARRDRREGRRHGVGRGTAARAVRARCAAIRPTSSRKPSTSTATTRTR